MASRAKTFSYAVSLDRDWTGASDRGGVPLPDEEGWTPEHLLLAGLARCTLTSLRYHAHLEGLGATGSADARGTVTRREEDGRYAFVELEVDLDVTFEPAPRDVRELLAKAERDCFVGASLTATPRYSWVVGGEEFR
ncbi:MAG: OsmC family protein [Actinobacteria bacterium]|nr:OsmC family protein [Actinomycetota bacterium]